MAQTDPIAVFAPDGKIRMIPPGQVDAALRSGGKRAQEMVDPAGKHRWIPEDQVQAATKAGGKPAGEVQSTAAQRLLGPDTSPLGAFINAAKNVGNHAVSAVTAPFHAGFDTPQDKAETGASIYGPGALAAYRMLVKPTVDAVQQGVKQYKAGNIGDLSKPEYDDQGNYKPSVISSAIDAIPVAGPWARNIENEARTKGAIPALAGAVTDAAVPEVVGKYAPGVLRQAQNLPATIKDVTARTIASDHSLSQPLPDEPAVSARERYNEAKDIGVNLDMAQATGAPIPAVAKRVTEHSAVGRGKFEANRSDNVNALYKESEHLLDRITPHDMNREDFGNWAKEKLAEDQNARYTSANNIFQELSTRGNDLQPDMAGVREQARQIVADNEDYYAKHPELLKGGANQAWSIVKDLARSDEAPPTKTVTSPLVDASGNPMTKEVEQPAPPKDTWSDLQRLRSDLMDQYRSPDIVGSRAEGWLKQLAGRVDESMTGAASGLSPGDADLFRTGNDTWSQMKDTYDNPQSPFYSILRAKEGLQAANQLANLKPQAMRTLNDVATRTQTPELVRQAQRQRVSRLLSPEGNDVPDLQNLAQRFKKLDKEQLNGVLEPDQVSDLERLSRVSKAVHGDSNPSGTAKTLQPAAEAGAIGTGLTEMGIGLAEGNPARVVAGAAPLATAGAQRVVANVLTSPDATNAVVNRTAPPPPKASTPVPAETSVPVGLAVENQNKNDDPIQEDKVVVPADADRGIQPVTLPTLTPAADKEAQSPVTHPLGPVTGIDHDSGLPIVKTSTPAPPDAVSPSATVTPPEEPAKTAPSTPGPQSSATEPTPDSHYFSLAAWQQGNPDGDPDAAKQAAIDGGFAVQA